MGLGAYLKHGSDFNSIPGVIAAIFLILLVGVGIELLVFRPLERRVLRTRGLAAGMNGGGRGLARRRHVDHCRVGNHRLSGLIDPRPVARGAPGSRSTPRGDEP